MRYGLRDWAEREPDRPALEFDDQPALSYAALEALANRFANLFRAAGLERGDHVAGVLPNGPHVIAAVWGAYRSGLYYTPVATTFSSREVAYVIANCRAKLVLGEARYAEALTLAAADLPATRFLTLGEVDGCEDLADALAAQPDTPRADETPGMLMMYSSGTTGAPKGIWRPLPDPAAFAEGPPAFARDLIEIFGFSSDTRYLSPAPLYHAAPLRWSLSITASGGTALIMPRFDAERALDLLETRGVTMSQWVPTMFRRMLALPEERLARFNAPAHKVAWHAAAPCPPDLKRRMIDWWGPIIHEYYAGSESVGLTALDTEEWLAHPGSVGRALKGRIRILGDDWQELPEGEQGRVYFSDSSQFEYFGDPEKTAGRRSPQGWQTLGEIGWVEPGGWLHLADRQDDMIISGGVNIYPQELEQALEEMPQVAECAVCAIPHEDFGERPVAFLVPAPGAPAPETLIEAAREFCRGRLGRTKQPWLIKVVEELPRSETGKLLRRVLRDQLKTEASADAA
ncbi:AMP-binding protein [uncultured Albimonas sp.]|uniref:AMP-binding protein n=1 Tax=uncultured Albimonas sp. TaxID=1331701 RepID=UPI0030EDE5E7|tara:strand:+ start:2454 stop:3998 length:1545 start_codon:yes stop_codon:yes gene_type:complete